MLHLYLLLILLSFYCTFHCSFVAFFSQGLFKQNTHCIQGWLFKIVTVWLSSTLFCQLKYNEIYFASIKNLPWIPCMFKLNTVRRLKPLNLNAFIIICLIVGCFFTVNRIIQLSTNFILTHIIHLSQLIHKDQKRLCSDILFSHQIADRVNHHHNNLHHVHNCSHHHSHKDHSHCQSSLIALAVALTSCSSSISF